MAAASAAAAPSRTFSTVEAAEALRTACQTLTTPNPQISPVTQAVVTKAFQAYAAHTPSVLSVAKAVAGRHQPFFHDHYAFRTFGVPGLGISSLGEPLRQLGYEQQKDDFTFPNKKLQATWFAPKDRGLYDKGLPRIFVSELEVAKLSPESQAVIHKYTSQQAGLPPAMAIAALLTRTLPWPTPTFADYQTLLQESEYAAWVLAHGYALNHTTLSVHRLGAPPSFGVAEFTEQLRAAGFPLNQEGGTIKVSPDGMLLQSSTVSDIMQYTFADGSVHGIAGSYVEFAERRPLKPVDGATLTELDRRDGFEVASADKIFMSTSLQK